MKRNAISLTAVLLASSILFAGNFATHTLLPVSLYAVPILAAAYLLPPRLVAGAAVYAVFLQTLTSSIHQSPPWVAISHLVGLVFIGLLGTALSIKTKRETALRTQAEGMARQREADSNKLRTIIDTIPASVVVCDSRGAFTVISFSARATMGDAPVRGTAYRPSEDFTLHRPDGSPIPPEEFPLVQALEQGEVTKDVEIRLRWKDGRETVVLASAGPMHDELGKITGAVGASVDITDRKRVEDALQKSEERYRTLAEAAQDHIFEINRSGFYEYVNGFAARQMGLSPGEIVGKRPEDLFPPEVTPLLKRHRQTVLETGEAPYDETLAPFPGGETWLGTWLVPIRDGAGEVTAVMGISRDITERKEAEQLKEQYVSFIGHDLKAPLSTVIGYAASVQHHLLEKGLERETKWADSILQSGWRMNSMIEDLLETTRLEAGCPGPRKERTDLRQLIISVAEGVGAPEEHGRLRVECAEGLPP